jgi:hypothetical protein
MHSNAFKCTSVPLSASLYGSLIQSEMSGCEYLSRQGNIPNPVQKILCNSVVILGLPPLGPMSSVFSSDGYFQIHVESALKFLFRLSSNLGL